MQLTYKFRLRDTCDSELTRQARAVNTVFNFCNETQQQAVKRGRKWLTWHDLQKLTAGSSKDLDIHAHTIQQVCQVYDRCRAAKKKPWLRWRTSNPKSPKRSLGWVPFNKGHVAFRSGAFVFRGREYRAWVSRDLNEGQTFGAGSFSQDSRGHWYINLPVEVESMVSAGDDAIGIDLGLKDLATISTGEKIEHPRWYRKMEKRIATAQRANKKKNVKKLYAKVKAQRADHSHKASARLVQSHGAIFVGNVNAAALAKTSMAKSVLDAGWSQFRAQLEYKAMRHQVVFAEVSESYSTQTCSSCGNVEGPKGVAGLGIRRWRCSCGVEHDRDVNAAKNIARRGLATLAEGAHSLSNEGFQNPPCFGAGSSQPPLHPPTPFSGDLMTQPTHPHLSDEPAVPNGWRTVPENANPEMLDAGFKMLEKMLTAGRGFAGDLWWEMISKAPAQPKADSTEPTCPDCHGSGEGTAMEGRGPDTYEVTIPCPKCGGSGVADNTEPKAKWRADVESRFCNKCGYSGSLQIHPRPNGTGECGYLSCLIPSPVNPASALPKSYSGSALVTGNNGSAKVAFYFDDAAEAERWHEQLTGDAPMVLPASAQAGEVTDAPLLYLNPKIVDPTTGKIAASGALTWSDSPVGGWTMPVYRVALRPKAQPLTEIEVTALWLESRSGFEADFERGLRAGERAHGIASPTKGEGRLSHFQGGGSHD